MDEYLIPLKTPCVYYDPSFLDEAEANEAYADLLKNTPWEKTAKINRWVTLMELPKNEANSDANAAEGRGYKYRDAPGASIIGFPPVVQKLKAQAEEWYNSRAAAAAKQNKDTDYKPVEFNVCLLNYYQNGSQRIGWHSDREELGRSTPIASISLGAPRQFLIRSKTDGVRDRASLQMANGSIVIMENICQLRYLHSVPKEGEVEEGRINLTFRCKQETDGTGADGETAGELEHEKRDHWITQIQTEGGMIDSTAGSWKKTKKEHHEGNGDETAGISEDGQVVVFGDNAQFYNPSIIHNEETFAKSVKYVVKTNIGAECYCAAEMEEVLDIEKYALFARPFSVAGYVAVCRVVSEDGREEDEEEMEGEVSQVEGTLLQLRSAHHVLRYHDHFDLNDVLSAGSGADDATGDDDGEEKPADIRSIDGEMLYQFYKKKLVAKEVSIPSLADLDKGGTFRTTCDRIGSGHGFQAPELERYEYAAWVYIPSLNLFLLYCHLDFDNTGRLAEQCRNTTHTSSPK